MLGKKRFFDCKGTISRQNLYNDGEVKERGRCHEIKPYAEFGLKRGGLRSICRECKKKKDSYDLFRNKFFLVMNLTNK